MRPVCQHIRIVGAGIDRQLIALEKQGFTLYDIRKINLKSAQFGFAAADGDQIRDFLTARGFSVTVLPPQGSAKHIRSLQSNAFLICLSLCALLLLSFSMRYVWHIEVRGAASYIGEIRLFLDEEGICPGIPAEKINTKQLSEALTRRLPKVAWVRVYLKGLALHIDVTHGVPMPLIETEGGNGNIGAQNALQDIKEGAVSANREDKIPLLAGFCHLGSQR